MKSTNSTRGAGRANKNTTNAAQSEERLDPSFAKAIKKFGDGAISQLKEAVDKEHAKRQKAAA